jgi:predicted Rossmann-fold nucleotide-binding protein
MQNNDGGEMGKLNAIAVFCGSADRIAPEYFQAATEFGRLLAVRGIRLVYGAGKTGLMGAVAESVLQSGGEVLGVVNESLNQPQLIHAGLTRLEIGRAHV